MKYKAKQRYAAGNDTSNNIKLGVLLAMLGCSQASIAADIPTGVRDLNLRWDNTLKYSVAARLKDPSDELTADPNQDDGDRSFDKGLISNRVDLLSQLDLVYKRQYGVRVSGAAWYDDVYNQSNDHDSPATANNFSVPSDEFNDRTEELHGKDVELLDAFAFGSWRPGGKRLTVRAGRHAILYGESLFFGNNGIAGTQAPTDVIKLLSVPNSQFQEIIRPVSQISSELQLNSNLSIGGFYQFEWEENRIPSAGSFFSAADVIEGGERFLLGPVDPTTQVGPALFRAGDIDASDSGQFGLKLSWRPEAVDAEFGFYAVNYHDKSPQYYLTPGAAVNPPIGKFGEYQLVYPEDIQAYGVSFSTNVGDANVAGEFSTRRDVALVSDPQFTVPGSGADNDANPAYAVGNSVHAQLSTIYIATRNAVWDSATFLGEVAWNRATSVKENRSALAANASRDAWATRFVFEPSWFQVAPGLDLSVPLGVGYSGEGNSSAVWQFNPGGEKGGDVNLGIKALYDQRWKFGASYSHFFGSEGTALNAAGQFSFKQSLADRDFVSAYVQRTF